MIIFKNYKIRQTFTSVKKKSNQKNRKNECKTTFEMFFPLQKLSKILRKTSKSWNIFFCKIRQIERSFALLSLNVNKLSRFFFFLASKKLSKWMKSNFRSVNCQIFREKYEKILTVQNVVKCVMWRPFPLILWHWIMELKWIDQYCHKPKLSMTEQKKHFHRPSKK